MTDLADNAAVVAAGYTREQYDRGVGKSPRWITRYSKPTIGAPGQSGGVTRAEVGSDISQADADAKALVSINGQRRTRYGAGATAGTGGNGGTMTFDSH